MLIRHQYWVDISKTKYQEVERCFNMPFQFDFDRQNSDVALKCF